MKITKIEATTVTVPVKIPTHWGWGTRTGTTRVVLQAHTDEGLVGIGETMGSKATHTIVEGLAAKMVGRSPFELERMLADFYMVPFFNGYAGHCAIAGIEMVCWDLIGKTLGKPLYELLGGKVRDEVAFSAFVFFRQKVGERGGETTPEAIVDICRELVDEYGFRVLKLKGGVFPPEVDVATVAAVRKAFGPGMGIRLDPNAVWDFPTSLRVAKAVEPYDLEYLEDPCWGIEAMARLRRDVPIPLATNMCVVDFETLAQGIRANAVDVILGDAQKWGGILATKKLAAVCKTFNLRMSMHCGAELGVSTAAKLHLAASTPEITYAVDGHNHHFADDIIKGWAHTYEGGAMRVPDGPGLGVELDEGKLGEYAEYFREHGEAGHVGRTKSEAEAKA